MRRLAAALLAVAALGACTAADGSEIAMPPGLDSAAREACASFVELGLDVDAGILTDGEARERMKAIYTRAKPSRSEDIALAAEDLLASMTGRIEEWNLERALHRFAQACAGTPVTTTTALHFESCVEAAAAGSTSIPFGKVGYGKHLDRNANGVACEAGE